MKPMIGIAAMMGLAAWGVVAQDDVPNQQMKKQLEAAMGMPGAMVHVEGGVMQRVQGSPYSAQETTESTQTLGDGTNIHNERTTKVYRDGQGRMRRESGDDVTIMDPVSGARYSLNTKNHTAVKLPLAMAVSTAGPGQLRTVIAGGAWAGNGPQTVNIAGAENQAFMYVGVARMLPDMPMAIGYKVQLSGGKSEDLGTQVMEGVVAQGTRTTRTIETGAIGNDRPINIVSERWFSPDLQTVVMSKQSDPREGETIFHLTNIQRAEPDPALFQVPQGYQLNDRKE